jgi:hypothetical protein
MPPWMYNALNKGLDWMAERQQRQTIRALQRLDPLTLVHLGLDPEEIDSIARSNGRDVWSRRRRALVAKSSLGIMAAAPRALAARPTPWVLSLLTRRAA